MKPTILTWANAHLSHWHADARERFERLAWQCWDPRTGEPGLASLAASLAPEGLADEQIRALRTEAAAAGDAVQVDLCTAALDGDDAARAACGRAIDAARAVAWDPRTGKLSLASLAASLGVV